MFVRTGKVKLEYLWKFLEWRQRQQPQRNVNDSLERLDENSYVWYSTYQWKNWATLDVPYDIFGVRN